MENILTYHKGESKDYKGCIFSYSCSKTIDGFGNVEKRYTWLSDTTVSAKTLKELKEKISLIG